VSIEGGRFGSLYQTETEHASFALSRNRSKRQTHAGRATQDTTGSRQCVSGGIPCTHLHELTQCMRFEGAISARGVAHAMPVDCVHAKQCLVLVAEGPLRRCVFGSSERAFVVSEFRDPGTRFSMTGARTLHRRCCRHHRAFAHRSRRTIAAESASVHTPRERCGVDLAPVSTAGCCVPVVVDKG